MIQNRKEGETNVRSCKDEWREGGREKGRKKKRRRSNFLEKKKEKKKERKKEKVKASARNLPLKEMTPDKISLFLGKSHPKSEKGVRCNNDLQT